MLTQRCWCRCPIEKQGQTISGKTCAEFSKSWKLASDDSIVLFSAIVEKWKQEKEKEIVNRQRLPLFTAAIPSLTDDAMLQRYMYQTNNDEAIVQHPLLYDSFHLEWLQDNAILTVDDIRRAELERERNQLEKEKKKKKKKHDNFFFFFKKT